MRDARSGLLKPLRAIDRDACSSLRRAKRKEREREREMEKCPGSWVNAKNGEGQANDMFWLTVNRSARRGEESVVHGGSAVRGIERGDWHVTLQALFILRRVLIGRNATPPRLKSWNSQGRP